mmetsp:Transcript_48677/g.86502  ORF Transcript_48677/g.86502 Transcript_48677/m.86502 type:complete len:281 (+) Transcript_48677:110-952(+)
MAAAFIPNSTPSELLEIVKGRADDDFLEVKSDASTVCSISETRALTQAQVLSLLGELLEGFSAPAFQNELEEVGRQGNAQKMPGRMQLALKVQSQVIKKYGFPGTSDGVLMMMRAVAPFLGHWLVSDLITKIDEKLGLPAGTTHAALIDLQVMQEGGMKKQVSEGCETASLESLSVRTSKTRVSMTRKQVLSMASELLDGFSTPEFQQKMDKMLSEKKSKQDPGRMSLALEVQRSVLPKYGFPGNTLGVVMMLDAISPFEEDWMVQHMLWVINDKLHMND